MVAIAGFPSPAPRASASPRGLAPSLAAIAVEADAAQCAGIFQRDSACSEKQGGARIGSYVDEVLAYVVGSGAQAQRYYPHYNHLYSVAALTDASGAVVERFVYDAYGNQKITSSGGAVRSRSAVGFDRSFTGYITDSESGLAYARNRMYSPSLGRFISRDNLTYSDDGPMAGDGYPDGPNFYWSPFVPNRLDPSGNYTSPYGLTDCILNSAEWIEGPDVVARITGIWRGGFDPKPSWGGVKYFWFLVDLEVDVKYWVNCEYYCRGYCPTEGKDYSDYSYDGDELRGPGKRISGIRIKVPAIPAPWPIPGKAGWKWLKLILATGGAVSMADFLDDVQGALGGVTAGARAAVMGYGPRAICENEAGLDSILEAWARSHQGQGQGTPTPPGYGWGQHIVIPPDLGMGGMR